MNKKNLIGIDLGSKMAGTTSICFYMDDYLHFETSRKNQDADNMITRLLWSGNYKFVFIDAPLSVPAAIYNKSYHNYFYRICDEQLGAMSPMFLGGLTARAIKLADSMRQQIVFRECYPAALSKMLALTEQGYKSDVVYINKCIRALQIHYDIQLKTKLNFWHEFDALLCWIIGWRYLTERVDVFGDENEGLIYV